MKKSEMKPFKELLLAQRARLRGNVSTLADAALAKSGGVSGGSASSVPSHIADMGSDTFEQDMKTGILKRCMSASHQLHRLTINNKED